jgi:hypothetical protein
LESSSATAPAASTALVAATVEDVVRPVDIGVAPRFHDAASAVGILWAQLEVASSDTSRDPLPSTAAADVKGIKSECQTNRHTSEGNPPRRRRGERGGRRTRIRWRRPNHAFCTKRGFLFLLISPPCILVGRIGRRRAEQLCGRWRSWATSRSRAETRRGAVKWEDVFLQVKKATEVFERKNASISPGDLVSLSPGWISRRVAFRR